MRIYRAWSAIFTHASHRTRCVAIDVKLLTSSHVLFQDLEAALAHKDERHNDILRQMQAAISEVHAPLYFITKCLKTFMQLKAENQRLIIANSELTSHTTTGKSRVKPKPARAAEPPLEAISSLRLYSAQDVQSLLSLVHQTHLKPVL